MYFVLHVGSYLTFLTCDAPTANYHSQDFHMGRYSQNRDLRPIDNFVHDENFPSEWWR